MRVNPKQIRGVSVRLLRNGVADNLCFHAGRQLSFRSMTTEHLLNDNRAFVPCIMQDYDLAIRQGIKLLTLGDTSVPVGVKYP